ncbi:MAG: immune inhibitor A [Chloroflexota bacterium]|nr:immune inhibitor A [Chloroflexota bacterium]
MMRYAAIIAVLALLTANAACNNPTPTTPVDTATPTPSPTAAPTPTPHAVSTATPGPTDTPVPVPSPTASPARPDPTPLRPTSTPPPTPPVRLTNTPSPTPIAVDETTLLTDAPDRDILSLIRRLRPDVELPLTIPVNPEPVAYEAGRTDTFWVADLEDLSMYQVDADLLYVSDHAYWYFQDGYEPREQDLQAAARAFDESIYPTVTGTFGTEWLPGIDNDPRLTILHTPLGGVTGYFSASDEYPKSIYPFSNEREMLYMSTSAYVGRPPYLGTLAHELQHAAHWAADPGEETWINEGLSEVAKNVADYPFTFVKFFAADHRTQLTTWPASGESTLPHYGAATLFVEYLAQHYGGHENLGRLVAQAEDGIEGVTAYLQSLGYEATFIDVFRDWLVANYLDSYVAAGDYSYGGLNLSVRPSAIIRDYGEHDGSAAQYSGEYLEIRLPEGDAQISFQGQPTTPILPTSAHSGSHCWWGNRGDAINSSLTAGLDLTRVETATLSFWTWYSIEESWDYAYVEVSPDGGETWTVLEGGLSSPESGLGIGFGPGYTGRSDGWQQDTIDLSPYAGGEVLIRFEYVTDEGVNDHGICIDDVSVPEIGFMDDAESPGTWEAVGFVRTDNAAPQEYLVQVIEFGDETTVRQMEVDQDGRGELVLRGFGGELEKAMVIVAPVAPKTSQPSSYTLSVEPAP